MPSIMGLYTEIRELFAPLVVWSKNELTSRGYSRRVVSEQLYKRG